MPLTNSRCPVTRGRFLVPCVPCLPIPKINGPLTTGHAGTMTLTGSASYAGRTVSWSAASFNFNANAGTATAYDPTNDLIIEYSDESFDPDYAGLCNVITITFNDITDLSPYSIGTSTPPMFITLKLFNSTTSEYGTDDYIRTLSENDIVGRSLYPYYTPRTVHIGHVYKESGNWKLFVKVCVNGATSNPTAPDELAFQALLTNSSASTSVPTSGWTVESSSVGAYNVLAGVDLSDITITDLCDVAADPHTFSLSIRSRAVDLSDDPCYNVIVSATGTYASTAFSSGTVGLTVETSDYIDRCPFYLPPNSVVVSKQYGTCATVGWVSGCSVDGPIPVFSVDSIYHSSVFSVSYKLLPIVSGLQLVDTVCHELIPCEETPACEPIVCTGNLYLEYTYGGTDYRYNIHDETLAPGGPCEYSYSDGAGHKICCVAGVWVATVDGDPIGTNDAGLGDYTPETGYTNVRVVCATTCAPVTCSGTLILRLTTGGVTTDYPQTLGSGGWETYYYDAEGSGYGFGCNGGIWEVLVADTPIASRLTGIGVYTAYSGTTGYTLIEVLCVP